MKITDTIKYVGVNDHQVDLFEGQYKVPNGMSYNSYVILDEKVAVMDTVDANFTHEWLDNIQQVLDDRKPDYLIVQHMEPDHAANVANFLKVYPDTTVVSNVKAFNMIQNFFDLDLTGRKIEVENGGTLSLGYHQLTFVFAPMVHWPEVMVTYDSTEKVLFSADGFGKFGALDVDEPWDDEAPLISRRSVRSMDQSLQKTLAIISDFMIPGLPIHRKQTESRSPTPLSMDIPERLFISLQRSSKPKAAQEFLSMTLQEMICHWQSVMLSATPSWFLQPPPIMQVFIRS